jgi:hypothetical protein
MVDATPQTPAPRGVTAMRTNRAERPARELPEAVTLRAAFGYWIEDGAADGGSRLRQWPEGYRATDPREIADLLAHGAPVEV